MKNVVQIRKGFFTHGLYKGEKGITACISYYYMQMKTLINVCFEETDDGKYCARIVSCDTRLLPRVDDLDVSDTESFQEALDKFAWGFFGSDKELVVGPYRLPDNGTSGGIVGVY